MARTLRKHEDLLLNWFRAEETISSGTVEGFHNKAKLKMRKSYGFLTEQGIKIALFHALGALPKPEFTHEFCCGGGNKREPSSAGVSFACASGWCRFIAAAG